MQWVKWAHSVVDYLAVAVGGDRGPGQDGGQLVRGLWGVLGVLEAMVCVCLDHLVIGVHAPHPTAPTQLLHRVPPHSSPMQSHHTQLPTQLAPHSSLTQSPHSPPTQLYHTAPLTQPYHTAPSTVPPTAPPPHSSPHTALPHSSPPQLPTQVHTIEC